MENNEVITKKVEFPDSIELGTPSKGGVLKVYFDASKPEEAKTRISNAAEILSYATSVKASIEVKQ